jgi:hypothetical protein
MPNVQIFEEKIPLTKEGIRDYVQKIAQAVDDGLIDPLRVAIFYKCLEDIGTALKENYRIKDSVNEAADKYHENTFTVAGAQITKNQRSTFDFRACDDSPYIELKRQRDELDALIKAREETIKCGIDPATGETLKKPIQKVTSYLSIKLLGNDNNRETTD